MLITKRTHYALVAILDLAKNDGDPVKIGDIAARQNLPRAFLDQIFSALKRARVVRVQKGPGGGYKLMNPPSVTKVADVVEALGDFDMLVEEFGSSEESKIVNTMLKELNENIWEFYKITLADLLKDKV